MNEDIELKLCTCCKLLLPLENFSFRHDRPGKLHSRCLDCKRKMGRERYYKNHERNREYSRQRSREKVSYFKDIIHNLKSGNCADCGNYYPFYVMDFDHTEPKSFNISQYVKYLDKFDLVLAEIEKCDLVCSNCHRRRTHTRKNAKLQIS